MIGRLATTTMLCASVLLTSSCGDDYTKNQDQNDQPADSQSNVDADAHGKSGGSKEPGVNDSVTGNAEISDDSQTADSDGTEAGGPAGATNSSSVTIQDILAGIFGSGDSNSSSNNANGDGSATQGGQSGSATPVEPAPEPTADDCIGADEFICAVEVAITYYTNQLRTGSDLVHHARLSYVARDWSRQQMERGSIGHQGFPSSRSSFYKASFPGDAVSIQAENVAYSSTSSTATAEDVAKMFVNMWKNSSGHRRNMLGNYEIIGVGVTKSGNRYYATQIFGAE